LSIGLSDSVPTRDRPSRWAPRAIFVITAVWVVTLSVDRALVWDEGMTLERLDLMDEGIGKLFRGEIGLSTFADRYWRFSRAEPDGHGPFYALLSNLGHHLSRRFVLPPLSYRLGPILFFSFAVAVLFQSLRRHLSLVGRLTMVSLLIMMPRLLPEVSFALIDGPLASLSMLAFASFWSAIDRGSLAWSACWGMVIGAAMATKLTGWFLPIPYIVWLASTFLSSSRGWKYQQIVLAFVAMLASLLLLNVGWWPDPIGGLQGYFQSNLTRRDTIPIPILFLGKRYDFSLPWYNTLVWSVVALPVGTVVMGGVGALWSIVTCRWDRFARLTLACWLLVIILRSLPQAPGHDGTRQIIVSFVFLAVLAGLAVDRLGKALSFHRLGWIVPPLLALSAAGESMSSVIKYHPLELSYYSPVVGGLPGAERIGFEPTYFWDSVTTDVRDWLRRETPAGMSVLFRNYTPSWKYLFDWNQIPEYFSPRSPPPRWFVLQHRPGQYDDVDREILARAKPVFQKEWMGVPLLSIFDINDWYQARQRVGTMARGATPP
jgi:hypothetical protein